MADLGTPKAGFVLVGLKDVLGGMTKAQAKYKVVGKQAMKAACIHMERETKKKLSGTRSGKEYKTSKKKKGKKHIASTSGEPPAVLTGRLRASITWNVDNSPKTQGYQDDEGKGYSVTLPGAKGKWNEIVGLVGTDVIYARKLELGDVGFDERPFLWPTMCEQNKAVSLILSSALKKVK